MRPKINPEMKVHEDLDLGPNNTDPKLVALCAEVDREKAQAGLQKVLDRMERVDAFIDDTKGDFVMCKECCMPCDTDPTSIFRRAFVAAGGGMICVECLCGGNKESSDE